MIGSLSQNNEILAVGTGDATYTLRPKHGGLLAF
jgi:hypothetical protein